MCSSDLEHGSATIKYNRILQTLKVGQKIPVRVGNKRAVYTTGSIAVNATAFIAMKPTQPILAGITKPSDKDVAYIKKLYDGGVQLYKEVSEHPEFSKFAKMLRVDWDISGDLNDLNAFSTSPDLTEKKSSTRENTKVAKIKPSTLGELIEKKEPFVATRINAVDNPTADQPNVNVIVGGFPDVAVQVGWIEAMAVMIDDWIDFITDCHDLASKYSGDDYKKIWAIYEATKANLSN